MLRQTLRRAVDRLRPIPTAALAFGLLLVWAGPAAAQARIKARELARFTFYDPRVWLSASPEAIPVEEP